MPSGSRNAAPRRYATSDDKPGVGAAGRRGRRDRLCVRGGRRTLHASLQIRSLAVLPLKPLGAGDNYLGLGIADAAIRRLSQTGRLIVRPTSAVRRYLN